MSIATVRDCHLYQHILDSTRGGGSNTPSCIDLLFTNEEGMISDMCMDSLLGKNYHSVITFKFNAYVSGGDKPKTRYKYYKED